jgi:hypothetical protein
LDLILEVVLVHYLSQISAWLRASLLPLPENDGLMELNDSLTDLANTGHIGDVDALKVEYWAMIKRLVGVCDNLL